MRPIGTAGETERRQGRAVELMQHGGSPTAKPHPGPQPRLIDEQIRALEGLLLRGAKAPVQETWHRKGRISAISDVTISPVLRRSDLVFRLLPNDAHAHGQENFARVGPTHRRILARSLPRYDPCNDLFLL